ncbi:hypothetical protein [Paenibacillus sp. FSL L8-0463]|uniref:hypothetical protein n=1 Tax=Paenibacillus sp. FSL L8-0463 TaxID=2954687 RepID=UPI003119AEA8
MISIETAKILRKVAFWLWVVVTITVIFKGFIDGTEMYYMIASIILVVAVGLYLFKITHSES